MHDATVTLVQIIDESHDPSDLQKIDRTLRKMRRLIRVKLELSEALFDGRTRKILIRSTENKIKTVKILRRYFKLSLKEAKLVSEGAVIDLTHITSSLWTMVSDELKSIDTVFTLTKGPATYVDIGVNYSGVLEAPSQG